MDVVIVNIHLENCNGDFLVHFLGVIFCPYVFVGGLDLLFNKEVQKIMDF